MRPRIQMSFLGWLRDVLGKVLRRVVPNTQPLCDTCKYDYDTACRRRERPNAMKCPDYKRR